MTLRVIREPSVNATTLGVLFLDDRFFAFTLEDEIREQAGQPVSAWKVRGQTAIPSGRYRVAVTFSPRFQRRLPELFDVPGFTGIRIHPGNRHVDTEGCLLVGFQRADVMIQDSRTACRRLQERIEAAEARGDTTWIAIENPMGYGA